MSGLPNEKPETPLIPQSDSDQLLKLVSARFQIEESAVENNIPTYYLKQPQETKRAFLGLLEDLKSLNLIALLRRREGRIVLRVLQKPTIRPSNIWINWVLLFATIGTTFLTGYYLSPEALNPFLGGATFAAAILAILGTHEMGHKLTADKRGVEATPPYFIPGPPPIFGGFGTFGAVIMQKSLPPNRDSLFDVGADGPIVGFITATVVSVIGLAMSIPTPQAPGAVYMQLPVVWVILAPFLQGLGLMPIPGPSQDLLIHPVAFAGWVGMIVTMLNLLPAGMLDGGHVARSIAGEKTRIALTAISILFLLFEGFYPMAILVLFVSLYRHPGPLDDVSGLSNGRKLAIIGLIAIFVLCIIPAPLLI